jgi:ABC-type transporter Mla subunit MlaD
MPGFDEPLWDQLAKALADINAWVTTIESRQAAFARQVSAVVRLQATARGLLARRRVRRLCDLQLIQPRTPSQFLQAVLRHAKADTA